MSISRAVSIWATAAAFLALPVLAQRNRTVAPRVTEAIDETKLHTLPGGVHPLARPEFDRGTARVDLPMDRMLLLLSRTPEQEVEVEQLIEQQQTPGSPNYHRWLTPEQFGERFGAAPEDIEQITRWLSEQGFRVDRVARGGGVVEFSGTATQVTRTFHTEIHQYLVNGEEHWANAQEPRIPAALATVIAGIVSLDDFPTKALHHSRGAVRRESPSSPWTRTADSPQFTYPMVSYTLHLLSPFDFATIYNVLPLSTAGLDGAGQTIAIAGRSNISLQDVRNFRSLFGLPARDPIITLNGPDPGTADKDDETENVLDVEWAGAVAKAATVNLVVSKTTTTTDGVDLSMEYIVDQNLAPVLSVSYGQCEKFMAARNQFVSNIWQQAAAQGITVVVAAGDQGSAVCDGGGAYARLGLQVNGLASTPYNLAVGGTDFSDGASKSESTYWNSTNAAGTNASAKSYIPEMTWNETCASPIISSFLGWPNSETLCNYAKWTLSPLSSGSGGASTVYSKPPWQSGVFGVPADGHRDLPDVSLFASTGSFWDTAYPYCQADQKQACDPNSSGGPLVGIGGGDSFGAPAFAGIMALVNQKTNSRQGLANPALYTLASLEYGGPGNFNPGGSMACNAAGALAPDNQCTFYDVTTGTNDVPCLKGSPDCIVNQPSHVLGLLSSSTKYPVAAYAANVGYDLATGLGSVNAANLVNNWPASACCNQPVLMIGNAHTGHFQGGYPGIYTVTIANSGSGPTSGTVVVTEMPPAGLSNIHMSGDGWNCAANTCSRSEALNPGSAYPVLYVSADVAPGAPSQIVNQASVSGGGSAQATASDLTTVTRGASPLTISKTHLGSFSMNQIGTYTLVVTNPDAHLSSSGVVKVTEKLPVGLTLNSMSGAGWDCAGTVCTRSDVLGPAASYPPITVTVGVTYASGPQPTNQATVSVDGSATNTASDPTPILQCSNSRSTNTTLVASPSTIKASETTTLSATVTASGANISYGTVSFILGGIPLSSSAVWTVNNRVTGVLLTVNGGQLAVGSNSLTAIFQGDCTNSPSTSSPVIVTVTPAPLVQFYTISTVAGTGKGNFSGDGGPAISAALNQPADVAVDPGGALYIVDSGNNRIRKVTAAGEISTLAGSVTAGFGGDDGLAISASLKQPGGIALDGAGNVFIADGGNYRIRKVTAAGIISTVAGNGTAGFSGDGGQATAAALGWPGAVAVDATGNLFIADFLNNRIRKVTPDGIISTVAGSGPTGLGTGGFGGDGGPAISAALNFPTAVAVDGAGNLFIADSNNNRIRKVSATGTISTVAGNGTADFSGDGGQATAAALHGPGAVAVDATGNLFIGDSGNRRVRKVDLTGTITTVAGNGSGSFAGDGGPAVWAALEPAGIAFDKWGHVFIADNTNNRIRQLTLKTIGSSPPPSSSPSLTISKTHSGSFSQGQTGAPYTIVVSNGASGSPTAGTVTVTENPPTGLNPGSMAGDGWTCSAVICLRSDALAPGASYPPIRVTMDVASNAPSQVTNQAAVSGGGSLPANASDVTNIVPNNSPIPTTTTLAANPGSIGTAGSTTLIATVIANGSGTPAGTVSFNLGGTLLGSATLAWGGTAAQASLAIKGSRLVSGQNSITASYAGNAPYDGSASSPAIVTVTQPASEVSGYTIATVAGSASKGFGGDGAPATAALLSMPGAVAVDAAGNLLIVDWGNHRIRRVTPAGIIDTIAGSGKAGFSGDDGPAISATLNQPSYVALDGAGNIFIADQVNNRIRKVSAAGAISTVAGSGTPGFSGDSGPAVSAALSQPAGVAVDAAGNLFIADYGNNRVRKVSPSGTITTIAGNGTADFSGDGGSATLAALNGPTSVAVDESGSVFIADYGNNRIRKVTGAGVIGTVAGSGASGFSGGGFGGDGGPATLAMLNGPSDVAVDATGRLFIVDSFNARVRMVDRAGDITTVAGDGNWGFAGDSGPAMEAEFELASGLALGRAGDIFIADLGNSRIRKLTPVTGPQIGMAGSTPSVFNAATLQTGGIAPNEFISLKGAGLGPVAGAISPGMSAQLGGSSVSIGGTAAYMTYAQDGQVNALVPFNVAGSQSTTIQVTYNGVAGNTVTVPVANSSPGIFTQSYGPGQAWIVNQDGTFNSPTSAAPRGTYVAFWVTGQGLVNMALADGVQPSGSTYPTPLLPLSVSLGDVAVPAGNIVFDGLIYSGEVQVNLLIPMNAPTGNAVPLVVTIGGASSRADASIAIQ